MHIQSSYKECDVEKCKIEEKSQWSSNNISRITCEIFHDIDISLTFLSHNTTTIQHLKYLW